MKILFLLIIVIICAILENLGQPWLSLFGVAIPLVLLAFCFIGNRQNARFLPWLGLAGGLILDVLSLNLIGTQALYYFIIGVLMGKIVLEERYEQNILQYKLGLLFIATALLPSYLAVVSYQYSHDWKNILIVSMIQTLVVMGACGLIFGLQSKKNLV